MDDAFEETIDLEPRSVDAIARRLAILAALVRRASFEPALESSDDAFMRETDRFDLYSWVQREAASDLTQGERRLLGAPAGDLSPEDLDECLYAVVPARALAWALRGIDMIEAIVPDPDISNALLSWAPAPWTELDKWYRKIDLRSDEALGIERERWELWYWRATLQVEDLEPGEDLADVVASVASEAKAAGLVSTTERDFAVESTAFHGLPYEDQDAIGAMAEATLLAMNWTCGFGDDWDSVPLYPE